ncbi:MAG: hypothetical protein GEV03_17030 [Streptosporangiales bacterium]|nr:hypothetical protein [Streptosporangiales bacterium]
MTSARDYRTGSADTRVRGRGAIAAGRQPGNVSEVFLRLQSKAGNASVTRLAGRLGGVVQRIRLDLPAGGSVGDPPATNHREGVMLTLDRLHEFWAIENANYDAVYPGVAALPPGGTVTDPTRLRTLQAALRRLEEPTLAAPVAAAQFGLNISGNVGRGQPNDPADIAALQDLLHVHWHLTNDAYNREHGAATSGGPLNETTLRETFAGITKLKRAAVAGTGKAGWTPLIRSDEAGPMGPGGQDRLADRTFSFGDFLIFVPTGATASLTNKVHVFFSAGGVIGADSHVEHHGLRGAADAHDWILFGVQGFPGMAFTISEDQVRQGLASVGRPAQIASVRMSAHSRGNGSMAATLRGRLFSPGLIDHVTVLDGSDFARSLTEGFRRSGVPPSKITADFVTTGPFPLRGVRSQGIDAAGIRALGYARLINDAVATGRVGTLPPAIASKVAALPLPPRGSFAASSPAPAGKINLNEFLRDPAHRAALRDLRGGERGVANVGQLASLMDSSPYAFVEWHNLLNINDESLPRSQWRSVSAGIYSHHLFVAEVGDDLFR